MATPAAAQSLDATDYVTVRQFGFSALSDLQLRIAGSGIHFNVHKANLGHHSTYFQHLIEADPQLTDIELVEGVPFTLSELDLFLMAIYGEFTDYLATQSPRRPDKTHFHEDQIVQWRDVKCRVDHYRQGELVPLDQLESEGQDPDWGQYRADEQALCEQNKVRFVPYKHVDLVFSLLSPSTYFQAAKLLQHCTSTLVNSFESVSMQQKLKWLAKFEGMNDVETVQQMIGKFRTGDADAVVKADAAWLDALRPETVREIMHKTLRVPKRYLS